MGFLWFDFFSRGFNVGLLPTQTIYFWVVEICSHVQTCILSNCWVELCSRRGQWPWLLLSGDLKL